MTPKAAMPTLRNSTKNRIEKAARDPLVLLTSVTSIQQRFRLSYPNARAALRIAEDRARKTGAWDKVVRLREQDRLIQTIRNFETAYPGVLREAVRSRNYAAAARRLRKRTGKRISRERVRQVVSDVKSLAKLMAVQSVIIVGLAERSGLRTVVEQRRESHGSQSAKDGH